jgi:hypothetical protein
MGEHELAIRSIITSLYAQYHMRLFFSDQDYAFGVKGFKNLNFTIALFETAFGFHRTLYCTFQPM